jgi:hypothetical protein
VKVYLGPLLLFSVGGIQSNYLIQIAFAEGITLKPNRFREVATAHYLEDS